MPGIESQLTLLATLLSRHVCRLRYSRQSLREGAARYRGRSLHACHRANIHIVQSTSSTSPSLSTVLVVAVTLPLLQIHHALLLSKRQKHPVMLLCCSYHGIYINVKRLLAPLIYLSCLHRIVCIRLIVRRIWPISHQDGIRRG